MAYYRAIIKFCDRQDNWHTYEAGDMFPRDGLIVSDARIKELAGSNNRMGYPLIKAYEPVKSQKLTLEPVVQEKEKPESKPDKKHKAPKKG